MARWCPPLPEELQQADRVTRVKDARGDTFVAWFPMRLKGYIAGALPGRAEPVRPGARSIWYRTEVYGVEQADKLAKRHLKWAPDGPGQAMARAIAQDPGRRCWREKKRRRGY